MSAKQRPSVRARDRKLAKLRALLVDLQRATQPLFDGDTYARANERDWTEALAIVDGLAGG